MKFHVGVIGATGFIGAAYRDEIIKETYGQMDVDRDKVTGWFSMILSS